MRPSYTKIDFGADYLASLFNEVKNLNWVTERSARQEYFMSFVPRTYSYGNRHSGDVEYRSNGFSPDVALLCARLNFANTNKYNVCFLNRYDDEKQHLGWHADDFPGMDETKPIAVVSLGAEREIWWKPKGEKGIVPPDQRQLLEHGSVFTMPPGFQDGYLHKIPKWDRPCGVRISLTFRSFK